MQLSPVSGGFYFLIKLVNYFAFESIELFCSVDKENSYAHLLVPWGLFRSFLAISSLTLDIRSVIRGKFAYKKTFPNDFAYLLVINAINASESVDLLTFFSFECN